MKQIVVAMFGLSGVGKSTIARRVVAMTSNLVHVEASALMRKALSATNDELRTAASSKVTDNQAALVLEFCKFRRENAVSHILFDGHSLIDGSNGCIDIPSEVVEGLAPAAIVFVRDEPANIIGRRSLDTTRKRPERSQEELAAQQRRALENAVGYSRACGVPLLAITPEEYSKMAALFVLDVGEE